METITVRRGDIIQYLDDDGDTCECEVLGALPDMELLKVLIQQGFVLVEDYIDYDSIVFPGESSALDDYHPFYRVS
jgi:hypothetical protein